jgi:hypothetical protein
MEKAMADEKTVPTWGYGKKGAQIFDLKEGESLPRGFYDHPDKVKGGASEPEPDEPPADA